MSQGKERRRKARHKISSATEPVWVILQNVPGRSGEVRAKVADMSDEGLGLTLPFKLPEQEVIAIQGLPGTAGAVKARVIYCA
ncbi:MAG TPA: hypothetical protein VF146_19700, partial [Bryobacteraceae bacterium]